jgi:hypothetical protein
VTAGHRGVDRGIGAVFDNNAVAAGATTAAGIASSVAAGATIATCDARCQKRIGRDYKAMRAAATAATLIATRAGGAGAAIDP